MVPVEIGARGSLRRKNYNPGQNEILQRRKLNFIEEKQCDYQLRVAAYQRRTT